MIRRHRTVSLDRLEARTLFAATVPPGFADSLVAENLFQPVAMAFAPDGRAFVTEKSGRVRVIKGDQLLPTPFATLTVNSDGERGALGVTVDPNFAQNNYVYVYYTATTPTVHNRVSRFTAAGDVADPASETVILELDDLSDRTNHNGGGIHFGPDGKLYVSQGENGDATQAQSLQNRFGKILRINADGSIPSDNPFFNSAAGDNRSIWAIGLRNPFTFTFRDSDGTMYINDVGQSTFEEINEGIAGANYGWPLQEGTPSNDPSLAAPVFIYGRPGTGDPSGTAITGGVFYQGANKTFPAAYNDDYFFADLGGDYIYTLDATTGAAAPFATDLGPAIDLAVGPEGSLYYVAYTLGQVRKIEVDEFAPTTITAQPVAVTTSLNQPATFTVQATGENLTYQWKRNGDDIAGATEASYTLPAATLLDNGATFSVAVAGSGGTVTSDSVSLAVNSNTAPEAIIISPKELQLYRGGQKIRFKGNATDVEDGRLPATSLTWRVDFFESGQNALPVSEIAGVRNGTFAIPRDTNISPYSLYRLTLTATNAAGLTSSISRDILPRTVQIPVVTTPAGAVFKLDGAIQQDGVLFDAVVGTKRSLQADATQIVDGVGYTFKRWSPGGKRMEFDYTVPASGKKLKLVYSQQREVG